MRCDQITLAQLGLNDEGPLAMLDAAAASGFRGIGLPLRSGALKELKYEIVGDRKLIRAIRHAADDAGLVIFDVESLVLGHEPDRETLHTTFETASELGATRMSCLGFEPSIGPGHMKPGDEAHRLATICAIAAEYGIMIGIEFMLFRSIGTLEDARKIVQDSGAPNAKIILDALHCYRSGLSMEELAALDPALISHLQLCDAVAEAPPPEKLVDEARVHRLMPGTGAIPLAEMIRILPDDIPLSLEIPVKANSHLPVAERAKLGAAALADFLP
jgi:sugar phosphate isomerase/epimerase